MTIKQLNKIIYEALEDVKGQAITSLDVSDLSDVMDTLVIATGTSNVHVKSLAKNVAESAKKQGFRPIGVEGLDSSEWVLVDFGDVVVHIMLAETREFYALEKLWSKVPANRIDQSES